MTQFLQATVNGLSLAAVYALIAIGFVVIYKSTQVLSFAQPALVLTGAYFVSYFAFTLGWSFWLGLGLAVLIAIGVGLTVERAALRPMIGKPVFSVAILTIGLDIAIRTVVNDLIGVDFRGVGSPWLGQWDWGGAVVRHAQVATVLITILLVVGVVAFFRFSRLGLAMRAAAFDQEVALAQGISVAVVFAVAWGMAGGLAAVAGMLIGTSFAGVSAGSAFVALKALPAIVVGGIDSLPGAVVGSLIVGLAEAYAATYQAGNFDFLGSNFSQVVPWLVMFVVLLIRPYGLFGTKEVERV
jgi:branched-chain amino acid transport system permease protein